MKVFSKIATALAVVPILAMSGSAIAGSPGQLAGGDNYVVKNLTTGGSYSNSINATCNDEVQYSMQLSNTQFGALTNVILKATLPSNGGTSTATATTDLGGTSGTSDSAKVTLGSGQTQALENGTTVLYDGSGNAIKALPDTVVTSGVNIGTLNGSTTEFVNFKVKVSCPSPVNYSASATVTVSATASATATCPPNQGGATATVSATGSATATANATSNVSQADANQKAHDAAVQAATPNAQANAQANANAKAQASVKCSAATVTAVSTPQTKTLPNTGPGDVAGAFIGTSAIGTAAHAFFTRRRRQ